MTGPSPNTPNDLNPAEPDALRRACQTMLEVLTASGPWLPADDLCLRELASSLKNYTLATRRMYRLTRSREACISAIENCNPMSPEVRSTVLTSLRNADLLSNNRLESVLPLMDAVTNSAETLARLTPESPLRQRVAGVRALEDACLKLEDAVNAGTESGSSDSLAPAAGPDSGAGDTPTADLRSSNGSPHSDREHSRSEPIRSESVQPEPEAISAAPPVVLPPPSVLPPSVPPPNVPPPNVPPPNVPPPNVPPPNVPPPSAPSPSAASAPSSPIPGGSGEHRSIPRLTVAQLREFLNNGPLPDGATGLLTWPERSPTDSMPNSWIQPSSCPICGADVLVAFGKSRKETIFCRNGHVLKFNQAQTLVQT